MSSANVYLTFGGNCEEAMNFYNGILGGEIGEISRFGEMPEDPNFPVPDQDKNLVMHMSITLGSSLIMGSDIPSVMAASLQIGNNFSISLNPETKEEADRIFAGLSEGGKVTMPMSDTFWNAYFGMCTDKYGINWMINVDTKA